MSRPVQRLAVLFVAVYFLWFAFDGTRAGWASDDPMNLYLYWKAGFARVLWSNLAFANGFYRPLGGLFYLPLYKMFGMNPAPYRWAVLFLLASNVWLLYRLARLLSGSERVALFAALLGSLHGTMQGLLYATADIYDILCRTFALLSLICYARQRRTLAIVFMILAINAKEIAATLPAFYLLYEIIYVRVWSVRRVAPVLLALAIAALAMFGKMHGAEAMTGNEMYRPIFTISRWFDANATYTNELLYSKLPSDGILTVWATMLGTCMTLKRREMWWALGFILLVTIPISFIPKRIGSSLYLPLAGWAIWIASLIDWAADRIRHRYLRWIALAGLACGLAWLTSHELWIKGELMKQGQEVTMKPLRQLQALRDVPPKGSSVLFLDSPFHDGFDLVFLASLVWDDHTLTISDANVAADKDPTHYDLVFKFVPQGVIRSTHE